MTVGRAPVVVLTYAHSGVERLGSLLSEYPELACTSGTGLLPLCEQAAVTWRLVDGRAGAGAGVGVGAGAGAGSPRAVPLSRLGVASIRAVGDSVIIAILTNQGRRRWCEISTASPRCAETFLLLYPGARFVCLHRDCPDVVDAGLRANPWRLATAEAQQFAAVYPGNNAAALAAYWAACAGPLISFEVAHPGSCLRVRYEDLVARPAALMAEVAAFCELEGQLAGVTARRVDFGDEVEIDVAEPVPVTKVLADALPPGLLAEVNTYQAQLDYDPLK